MQNKIISLIKSILKYILLFPKSVFMRSKAYSKTKKIYTAKYKGKIIALLRNDTFGPMCMNFKLNLRDCIANNLDPKTDVIFIAGEKSTNLTLQNILARHATIIIDQPFFDSLMAGGIDYLLSIKKGLYAHYKNGVIHHPDIFIDIPLTEDDEQKGQSILNQLKLNRTDRIVLVHNKDQTYYLQNNRYKKWDFYRDSSFETLLPAISMLKKKGYKVIRMGHYTTTDSTNYISINDLSPELREFCDFYLTSICDFCLYGTSGIANTAYLLNKPLCLHNFIPMGENVPLEQGLFLPKKLTEYHTQTELPPTQLQQIKHYILEVIYNKLSITSISADHFQDIALYLKNKIQIHENSEQEIINLVTIFLDIYIHKLPLTSKEIETQNKFKHQFQSNHPMREMLGYNSSLISNKHNAH